MTTSPSNRLVNGYRLVSNSEVQTFKECRRKWWLQWYRGLTPRHREVTGVRSNGTRLHVALENGYQPGMSFQYHGALKALHVAQEADLALLLEQDPMGDPADLKKDFVLEQIMLEGYAEWLAETGEDQFLKVIASETYVEAEFLEGNDRKGRSPVKIIGKIDTRFEDIRNGHRKIMDHKSVVSFIKPTELGLNEQTLHYLLLEFLSTPEGEARCDAALYNMLRRVKRTAKAVPPFYQRLTIERNQHELDSYRYQLAGVITDLQDVEHQLKYATDDDPELLPMLVYKRYSNDCHWKCPFFKVCRMFDDGSRVEAALEAEFEVHDPMEYYQGKEREE